MGSHSVTCHPTQVNEPRLNPSQYAGTRFTYPGRMEGWVDLGYPAMYRPGVELAISRSQVRRLKPPSQQQSQSNYKTGLNRVGVWARSTFPNLGLHIFPFRLDINGWTIPLKICCEMSCMMTMINQFIRQVWQHSKYSLMNSGGRTTRQLTVLTVAFEKTQVKSNYYRTNGT